jgi:hypothetical protein
MGSIPTSYPGSPCLKVLVHALGPEPLNMGSLGLATDSCEKSLSMLCRKSWVFPGRSGFLPQERLTGWVRINIVKKVITIVVKINCLG